MKRNNKLFHTRGGLSMQAFTFHAGTLYRGVAITKDPDRDGDIIFLGEKGRDCFFTKMSVDKKCSPKILGESPHRRVDDFYPTKIPQKWGSFILVSSPRHDSKGTFVVRVNCSTSVQCKPGEEGEWCERHGTPLLVAEGHGGTFDGGKWRDDILVMKIGDAIEVAPLGMEPCIIMSRTGTPELVTLDEFEKVVWPAPPEPVEVKSPIAGLVPVSSKPEADTGPETEFDKALADHLPEAVE